MKKLRVMLISGIIARSWNTVAMPRSSASRGPDMRHRLALDHDLARARLVHARERLDQGRLAGAVVAEQAVDLARRSTVIETPESAITEPNCLLMFWTSISGCRGHLSALP